MTTDWNWFVPSLVAAVLFTVKYLLGRELSVRSVNPHAFSVIYNLFCGSFALGLFLIEPLFFTLPPVSILLITTGVILLNTLYSRTEFYARKYIEASMLTVFIELASVVTFVTSIILLRESVTIQKIIASMLIFGGTFLLVAHNMHTFSPRSLRYSLIMAISLGLAWTMDKRASIFYSLPLYAFLTYAVPGILLSFLPGLPRGALQRELQHAPWKISVLSLVEVGAYYSVLKAFQYGEASKVILVVGTSTMLTVVAGIIFLKERSSMLRKMLAAIAVSVGVWFLR